MGDHSGGRAPRVAGIKGRHRDAEGAEATVEAEAVEDELIAEAVEDEAAAPAEAKPSRAGRNLPAAIGVAAVLVAILLLSLHAYRPSFVAIVLVALGYATYELVQAIARIEARPPLLPLLIGGASIELAAWHEGVNGIVVALFVAVCGVAVWRLTEGAAGYLRDTAASIFVLLYLPLLAGFAVLLAHPDDGAARVTMFILVVAMNDTGGYASGVFLGKRPLAPMVSKGKTWEGFGGSIVACSVAGALVMSLTFHEAWWKGVLFGLAIVVVATLGDLGESMIKRDLGLKDMGTLLPGHGGIMDRLDSLLPCAPVAYLLLAAFA